ncbi:hypothetical protein [Providencia rettgeri]|uniref:hypothetical protein n=1 Tax=Providencia rettgeri TaxID=587 RepID=UPI0030105C2F
MKTKSVLIYGEYSGYGKSLAKGFRKLGYRSEVLSFSGDGFKKINSGLQLHGNNKLKKLISLIKLIPEILSYKNIIVMNPDFFKLRFLGPLMLLLFKITGKNLLLLCCGDDVEFIRQGKKGNIENWPYADIPLPSKKYFSRKRDLVMNYLVANYAYKIIPVMYDYHKAWSYSKFKEKLVNSIPLACDGEIKKINKKDFNKEKIVIMHGINREGFKGSKEIKLALAQIKEEYRDNIEVILPERLPLNEYLRIMEEVDISIDQAKGNSYGMNAIYSMFSGHIVLAPANSHFTNNLNLSSCPVISIENNKNSIVYALKKIILNHSDIFNLKVATQNYAIQVHSSDAVAHKIEPFLK